MAIRGVQEVVWNGAGWGRDQGDLLTPPGWTLVGFEDFLTDAPVGSMQTTYPTVTYYDAYYDTSKNGYYNPSKTLSAANSVLSVNCYSEAIYSTTTATASGYTITTPAAHGLVGGDHILFTNVGSSGLSAGTSYRVVASPGATTLGVAADYATAMTTPTPLALFTSSGLSFTAWRINVGALLPFTGWAGQVGGRYSVRLRSRYTAGAAAGFKAVPLGWPVSDNWNEGEWDWPEGDLGSTPQAFAHMLGNPSTNTVWASAPEDIGDWHIYTVQWDPTASTPYLQFYFDGTLLASTPLNSVPVTAMRWVVQIETSVDPASPPAPTTVGLVEIDWVAQWKL